MSFDEFKPLNEKSLVEYIKATPALSSRLGDKYDDLVIKEVGDGNLNFVFIVIGSTGSLVIKQVLSLSHLNHNRFVITSLLWKVSGIRVYLL